MDTLLQIQIDLVLISRCLGVLIWGILYAIWLIAILEEVLEDVTEAQIVAKLSKALGLAHHALDSVQAARQGQYHGKR
jgi:hypothetical protein